MASIPKRRRLYMIVVFGMLVVCLLTAAWTVRSDIMVQHWPVSQTSGNNLLEDFLDFYNRTCHNAKPGNNITTRMEQCPCVPETLMGWADVSVLHPEFLKEAGSYENMETENEDTSQAFLSADSHPAGKWRPKNCVARQSVAIIIPFHDREKHLQIFLRHMHPFLQRQQLEYAILIIEQDSPKIFNRAALLNIGFVEGQKLRNGGFDCYIFHDVDLLPEDDRNFYSCYLAPLHLGAYMNKFNYQMPYGGFFGGAVAMTGAQVRAINGFSNSFYGWGGEDDDTLNRVRWKKLQVHRYPSFVGRSSMIYHEPDRVNPKNPRRNEGYKMSRETFLTNGLSSLRYTRKKIVEEKDHIRIIVNIVPEWDPACIVNHAIPPSVNGNYVNCLKEEIFLLEMATCCREHGRVFCCQNPGGSWSEVILGVVLTVMLALAMCTGYYCCARRCRHK